MTTVVRCFSMSLDGFAAAPEQSLENPFGEGGMVLADWLRGTRYFQAMFGADGGSTGIDNDFTSHSFDNIGAWILGRNMFSPLRGAWADESWRGWWGDNPPYHTPVFVLTHHARPALTMEGGTTFHFVTGGIEEALRLAREAAGGKDVRIGGGACTIRQYLQAGLIDQLHVAVVPVLLGRGEPLLAGLDLPRLGYRCVSQVASPNVLHVTIAKAGQSGAP